MPLALGAVTGSPFCIARNHGQEEAKAIVDKRETRDFAPVSRDSERIRLDIAKVRGLSPSTVSTAVGKKKLAEANTLVFNGETKEAREAKHAGSDAKVFLWFNNTATALDTLQRYFSSCGTREQLLRHWKRTLLSQHMFDLSPFFQLKIVWSGNTFPQIIHLFSAEHWKAYEQNIARNSLIECHIICMTYLLCLPIKHFYRNVCSCTLRSPTPAEMKHVKQMQSLQKQDIVAQRCFPVRST